MHLRYTGASTAVRQIAALRRAQRFAADELVVIDRHWLSEQVYARVFRNGTTHNAEGKFIFGWLKAIGAHFVFCCPTPISALERHRVMHATGREMYKPDVIKLGRVVELYLKSFLGDDDDGLDLLGDVIRRGGLKKILGELACRYDIDKDGDKVIDFADDLVTRLMMQRNK